MENPINTLPPYVYNPLNGQQSLRLLRLRPAAPEQEAIDCELFESPLIDTDSFAPKKREEDYEAVSWCWGSRKPKKSLRINDGDNAYSFPISRDLESALRAFRHEHKARVLWVDAICIQQADKTERNQQVPKMNLIYGQASNVCIWIGDEDKTSRQAFRFIKEKVLKLWDFDKLCEQSDMGEQWRGMSMLMKRPWFSRRWVVQEIALAERAVLYCGKDEIPWQDFADAVSLFVEAESVAHKLSDVMRKDLKFDQIPDFYGYVPALGAALLVDATSNLFRSSKKDRKERRERLLSLEHLVSKYTVFEARVPHDTIYALLAIARDTTPRAIKQDLPENFKQLSQAAQQRVKAWLRKPLEAEVYTVDYNQQPLEVYKEFVTFAIVKSEPRRALNIICRSWAPSLPSDGDSTALNITIPPASTEDHENIASSVEDLKSPALPSWISDLGGATFIMQKHPNQAAGERMARQNADPLVGMPGDNHRSYSAAGAKNVNIDALRWHNRGRYYSMFVEGFVFDEIQDLGEISRRGVIPDTWLKLAKWYKTSDDPPEAFWRTLVADRGPHGGNTRSFYPRACKEAMTRGTRGELETKYVIEHGGCSIIANFLDRVQAVIWNRRLVRTKNGHLGLVHREAMVGDRVCVLYGCSVPVILRKFDKSAAEVSLEREEAETEAEGRTREAAILMRKARDNLRERERKRKEAVQEEVHDERRPALRVQLMDWTLVRFVWFIALIAFLEYRLGLNFQQAALVNSPLIIYPQLLKSIKPTLNAQAWGQIRKWVQYARLVCIGLLAVFVGSWINLALMESIFFTLSIVVLLPSLILSSEDYKFISSGGWFFSPNKKIVEKPLEKVPEIRVPEPTSSWWQLIGECYIDGMMDGEAIAYQNDPDNRAVAAAQIFEIR